MNGEERKVVRVVEVSMEVRSGVARFRVTVRAESIRRATDIVAARYPGGNYWVKFPVDPGRFFVSDVAADRAGIVGLEEPDVIAA